MPTVGLVLLTSVLPQEVYELYLQGCGQKEIARRLNRLGRKTPRQLHDERCQKAAGKYLWTYQSVKNVLSEVSYTGVLANHRTETHCHKPIPVECDQQFRHEYFYPVIIDRERWEQVQALSKANTKPFHGNTASHRYAGLLQCGDCGSTFVPRTRYWNGNSRVEYLCKSYMHHGKNFCLSHRIRESELDEEAVQFATGLHHKYVEEQAELNRLQKLWEQNRSRIEKEIAKQYETISRLEQEIDVILMERIHSEL